MTTPKKSAGRPAGKKDSYARQKAKKAYGLRKLQKLLSGYIDNALITAERIMNSSVASDRDRLSAAKMFIDKYSDIEHDIAKAEHLLNTPFDNEADDKDSEESTGTMGTVLSLGIVKKDDN